MKKFIVFSVLFVFFFSIASVIACGPPTLNVELKTNASFFAEITSIDSNSACLESITHYANCTNENDLTCQRYNYTECLRYKTITKEIKFNCNNIVFESYQIINKSFVLELLNSGKEACGLNNEDIDILSEFIFNGYSVKEQNDDEYSDFLSYIKAYNQNSSNKCQEYDAVYHKRIFTGYHKQDKFPDSNGLCNIMKRCGGSVSLNMIWNDLSFFNNNGKKPIYFIAGIIILILLILIYQTWRVKK